MLNTQYRLIGEELYIDMMALLKKNEHIALLGPRHGGKAMVLDKIKKHCDELPEIDKPTVIHLLWSDFRQLTQEQTLQYIAYILKIDAQSTISSSARLSGKIVDMLRTAVETNRHTLWVFVQDILGFPKSIARQLLEALYVVNGDDFLHKHISAVVTGSVDFVPLTYGSNSPFQHAKCFVVAGLDKECAKSYFCECRARQRGQSCGIDQVKSIDEEIEPRAFNYLYKKTGGAPSFIQELIGAAAHYSYTLDQNRPSEVWAFDETAKWIEEYQSVFMHDNYYLRASFREIENHRESFELVVKVMKSETGKIAISSGDIPQQLAVSGLLKFDREGVLIFSSPMMEKYIRDILTERHLADIYVFQGRWVEAWEAYKELPGDLRDRPVSGDARFRLRDALLDWHAYMLDEAHNGVDAVVNHFLNGMQYLYAFDSGGVYNTETMEWVTRCMDTSYIPSPLPEWKPSKIIEKQKYWLDSARMKLWSDPGIESLIPGKPNPAILFLRNKPGYEIDATEQESLWKTLPQFWTAYEAAQEIEYRKTIGDLRRKHLKVIEAVILQLAEDPFDMGGVVQKTVSELIDTAGYYRVIISLVDPKCEKIQTVASKCHDITKEFTLAHGWRTDFDLPKGDVPNSERDSLDIEQVVAIDNRTIRVADVCAEKQEGFNLQTKPACEIGMKAITVVPMSVGDEVIGTIHLERSDKEAPTDKEVELFEILARQLAVIFRQAERITLLEGAVTTIDDDLSLIDPNGNPLFRNPKSTGRTGFVPGWQQNRLLKELPGSLDADEIDLIDQATKHGVAHFYRVSQRGPELQASNLQIARIDDFRTELETPFHADGLIGFLKLTQDITPLYQILTDSANWLEAHGVGETAGQILKTFEGREYEWCRIFLVKGDSESEMKLQSYAQFGLKYKQNIDMFENGGITYSRTENNGSQPWHILLSGKKEPVVYRYSSEQSGKNVIDTTSRDGLPLCIAGDILDRDTLEMMEDEWIEAPLIVGGVPLGKMSLSIPNNLGPGHWQLLKLSVQMAALALEHAILSERDIKAAKYTAEMATRILHNLRSPLAACEAFARTHQEKAHAYKLSSRDSVVLMDEILNALSRMERVSSEYMRYIRGYIPKYVCEDIIQELQKVCKMASTAWEYVNIEFYSPLENLLIETDINAVTGAVDEFIYNAVKARAPRVNISLELVGSSELQIIIEDDGPGIRENIRQVLFEPKLEKSTEGTGLGLAIIYDTITALGGQVFLESSKPGCTRFIIKLPCNRVG